MAEILRIWVQGIPKGKPRATFRCVPQVNAATIAGYMEKPPFSLMSMFDRAKALMRFIRYMPVAYHDHDINADCDLWQKRIKQAVAAVQRMPEEPIAVPVRCDVDFYFPRPEYLMKPSAPAGRIPYDQKPDRDNADKAVLDALTTVWKTTRKNAKGIAEEVDVGIWDDDKRVCQGEIQKWYVAKGGQSGAWIIVQTLTDAEPALFDETKGAIPAGPVGFATHPKIAEKPVHPAKLLPGRPKAVAATDKQFRCDNCNRYFVAPARQECPNCATSHFVRELRPGAFDGKPLADAPAAVLTDWDEKPVRTV